MVNHYGIKRLCTWSGLITILSILFSILLAEAATLNIIENPASPPNPKAGRVLRLKEVQRITDEGGKFFFEQPLEVCVGGDGCVYVQEFKKLLKFDVQGHFVKNLLKWGEGPGEMNGNLTDVIIEDHEILLFSSNTYKLIRIDLNGKLLDEKRFSGGFSTLLGSFGGRYVVLRYEWKDMPERSGIFEEPHRLGLISESGEFNPTGFVMPLTVSRYLRTFGGRVAGASMGSISRFMPLRVGPRLVYLFHSPEYLIKVVDLEKAEVVRSFRRTYDRVRYEYQLPKNMADYPEPKYHNDLSRLLWHDGLLWAVTSRFDKSKGILVDVFSPEGKYVDCFYLPLLKILRNNPQYYIPLALHGNFLYHLEADENELMSLVKYEILGR